MVKVGAGLGGKPCGDGGVPPGTPEGPPSWEGEGSPALMSPLDVTQLHYPVPDKIIIKTRTNFQPQPKRRGKLGIPNVTEFTVNFNDSASEKFKLTLLVMFGLAFLACVVFLVVYKVYKYEQSCPEGSYLQHKRCVPVGLMESYYAGEGVEPPGRFLTLVNRYTVVRQSLSHTASHQPAARDNNNNNDDGGDDSDDAGASPWGGGAGTEVGAEGKGVAGGTGGTGGTPPPARLEEPSASV
ncbi:neuronal vesicle trafficking-associated protein 1-like [Lethenteron reissneri]|uniref:neuronal vesicle trafficking-associated protein 1-like n=1 Tax=Lethenteron reissneri TaxID=7753 RepID=UPI002AB66C77|nr:neuronal vesicle trafficking-associated protein 1-like [Lethenteron reissneri]